MVLRLRRDYARRIEGQLATDTVEKLRGHGECEISRYNITVLGNNRTRETRSRTQYYLTAAIIG